MLRFEWFALTALVAATLVRTAPAPRPPEWEPPHCTSSQSTPFAVDPRAEADQLYRRGDFGGAAETIRRIADTDELRSLAELYQELATEYPIGMAESSDRAAAFQALRRAQTLDMALGGALSDPLTARMRFIAPLAAAAFHAAGAGTNYELAQLTAETLGAR